MRRLAAIGVLGALSAGASLSACGSSERGYRVDAIFDNAAFLTPDQKVTVAGAEAGKVVDLQLTEDRRARVVMEIDERFTPFRSDAECTIQPQSLIGERFVDCTPGTPRGRALRSEDGTPTLPVGRTHAPVDLDLVLSTFGGSTRERLALLLSELGAGLAGRAEDLDATIRRANPALAETRRVLAILRRDRRQLGSLVADAERVLRPLARRRARIADFIDQAEGVSAVTARRRAQLAATIRGLPLLLTRAGPALREFTSLAGRATPLARDLRAAAPEVERLVRELGPFAVAARPALRRVAAAAEAGTRAAGPAAPQLRRLRRFAATARPVGAQVAELLTSLRDRGVVERAQTFLFFASLVASRFDQDAHIPVALAMPPARCVAWAETPVAGCSARFASAEEAPVERRRRSYERREGGSRSASPQPRGGEPRPDQDAPQRTPGPADAPGGAPSPPPPPRDVVPPLSPTPPPSAPNPPAAPALPALPPLPELRGPRSESDDSVLALLDFLLG